MMAGSHAQYSADAMGLDDPAFPGEREAHIEAMRALGEQRASLTRQAAHQRNLRQNEAAAITEAKLRDVINTIFRKGQRHG